MAPVTGMPPNTVEQMVATSRLSAQAIPAAAITAIKKPGQAGRHRRKPTMMPRATAPTAIACPLTVALGIIVGLRRWRPAWPGFLIAVIAAAGIAWALNLDVATISSRFGALPRSLPDPSLPAFSLAKLQAVLPDAVTIALLGAIESLLSAVVADGMSGRRHRSNCELVAQGVANIGSTVFGGIPVTGAIARTATNIRAGAKGPVSGILHAGYLLVFMLVAAPLAGYIPLAALGAVLAVVAWNMSERHDFIGLLRASGGDRLILLATFLLTVFVDLTTGIGVGVVLGAFIFLHRMAESVEVEGEAPLIAEDLSLIHISEPTRRTPI